MVVLALALGYFAFDKFALGPRREAQVAEEAREAGRSAAMVESFGNLSIAVLPFADMSPGRDQGYFSDGITEELLNLLARVNELRVISRSSSFGLRDENLSTPEIAAGSGASQHPNLLRARKQFAVDVRQADPAQSSTYSTVTDFARFLG